MSTVGGRAHEYGPRRPGAVTMRTTWLGLAGAGVALVAGLLLLVRGSVEACGGWYGEPPTGSCGVPEPQTLEAVAVIGLALALGSLLWLLGSHLLATADTPAPSDHRSAG